MDQTVHHAIVLEMEWDRDLLGASARPFEITYGELGDQAIPPEKPLIELFDESKGYLLILGEPGAGKTVTLMQLGREMALRASQDRLTKIPIPLALASFRVDRNVDTSPEEQLIAWMAKEVYTLGINHDLMWENLLPQNEIILLLDGLDEVKVLEERERVVEAINRFRTNRYAGIEMVVTCRVDEYKELNKPEHALQLENALQIQPLSDQMIDRYFETIGTSMGAVRSQVQEDSEFREIARTPLFLSLMPIAYNGVSRDELESGEGIEVRRGRLMDTYIQRMFDRRPLKSEDRFTLDQALVWLQFIAFGNERNAQQRFLMESLDDRWLTAIHPRSVLMRKIGLVLCLMLGTALLSSLMIGIIVWLFNRLLYGFMIGAIYGMLVGLFVGMIVGRRPYLQNDRIVQSIHFELPSWRQIVERVELRTTPWIALIFGIIGGVSTELSQGLDPGWVRLVIASGLGVIILLILSYVINGVRDVMQLVRVVALVEPQSDSAPNQGLGGQIRNIIMEKFFGWLVVGVSIGIVLTFLGVILGAIRIGVGGEAVQSGANLIVAIVVSLLVSLPIGLLYGLVLGLMNGLIGGVSKGLIIGANHYLVRRLLARAGVLPTVGWFWQDQPMIHTLDALADRILLRRIGGHWIFIHRYLQEHLASQFDPSEYR